MRSAISALADENKRIKEVCATIEQVIVDRDAEITRLRREVRDMSHEIEYYQRKFERMSRTQ